MWILIVVRFMALSATGSGDMMLSQEFATEQSCKAAGEWIVQQQYKSRNLGIVKWTCLKNR